MALEPGSLSQCSAESELDDEPAPDTALFQEGVGFGGAVGGEGASDSEGEGALFDLTTKAVE